MSVAPPSLEVGESRPSSGVLSLPLRHILCELLMSPVLEFMFIKLVIRLVLIFS